MFRSMLLLAVLFGSLALGFYCWNQVAVAQDTDIAVRGVFHEGRVCEGNNCSSTPYVTFQTKKGTAEKFYPFQSDLAHQQFLAAFYDESAYRDGQSVPVLYDPVHPAQALITSPQHAWLDAGFWWLLGACMLLGLFVRVMRQDRGPKKPSMPPMPPRR